MKQNLPALLGKVFKVAKIAMWIYKFKFALFIALMVCVFGIPLLIFIL